MTYDNEWVYSGLGIPESDDNENLDLTVEIARQQQQMMIEQQQQITQQVNQMNQQVIMQQQMMMPH